MMRLLKGLAVCARRQSANSRSFNDTLRGLLARESLLPICASIFFYCCPLRVLRIHQAHL